MVRHTSNMIPYMMRAEENPNDDIYSPSLHSSTNRDTEPLNTTFDISTSESNQEDIIQVDTDIEPGASTNSNTSTNSVMAINRTQFSIWRTLTIFHNHQFSHRGLCERIRIRKSTCNYLEIE